jgi:hypothetical protein
VARTVCRRVERRVVRLAGDPPPGEAAAPLGRAMIYLNRLSDYLFVFARCCNRRTASPTPMESVSRDRGQSFAARILSRRWLSPTAFELTLERPPGFNFHPGQRVRLGSGPNEREYSIAAAPGDPDVALCIRRVIGGEVSTWLSTAGIGTELRGSGRRFYRNRRRGRVFVATGTE